MSFAFRVERVTKSYKGRWPWAAAVLALADVSLDVERGEALGIRGHNRAGKSTLLKLMLSLCRPTSGRIERLDRPASDRSTLARIGYVPDQPCFPAELSPEAILTSLGRLSGLAPKTLRNSMPSLLDRVGLAEARHRPVSSFSRGMIQRLALAQALQHRPEVLVLDEPCGGLDDDGRRVVLEAIADHRAEGGTTLLVSHHPELIQRTCDRVVTISGGRLEAIDPIDTAESDSQELVWSSSSEAQLSEQTA